MAHGGRSEEKEALEDLERWAHWLDSVFELPGTRFRFGLDPLIGLIPGFGDLLGLLMSMYLLYVARRFALPRATVARMTINVAIDATVGSIPLVGDLFDAYWKVNQRNLAVLKRHLGEDGVPARKRATRGDQWFVACAMFLLAVMVAGCTALMAWLVVALVQWMQSLF